MNFLSWPFEEIEASFLEFAKFGVSRSFHVASRSFHVASHNVFGIRHVTHRIKTETRLCWPFRALITEMTHCGVNQLIAWHRPHFTFNLLPSAYIRTSIYMYVWFPWDDPLSISWNGLWCHQVVQRYYLGL